jgi:hypothetical protein
LTEVDFRKFVVDASTWIRLYDEHYPTDVFPSLWHELARAAADERLISPSEVLREVGEADGVGAWLRMQKPTIVPKPSPAITGVMRSVMTAFPKLVHGKAASADPWVIAYAQHHGYIVVTEEKAAGPKAAVPRIPDVCAARDVEWIDGLRMLKELGIRLCPPEGCITGRSSRPR